MYTMIERWTGSRERLEETGKRAQTEWFPKLQAAPGFVSFYLVDDEAQNIQTAILAWESQAHAEALTAASDQWRGTLNELGNTMQSENRGETVITIEPKK